MTSISVLYCCSCGSRNFVPRFSGKPREKGHTKKFWCTKCASRTRHLEVRDGDFDLELIMERGVLPCLRG